MPESCRTLAGTMRRRLFLLLLTGAVGGLYLANASWLASRPRGAPQVVAQRGLSQSYASGGEDENACTAQLIRPPVHQYIDNTLPSVGAAFSAGAQIVEVDTRITLDQQFVLFHDDRLECRTDGHGRISAHTVAQLQTLDVGYGYTADHGQSYPLRGKGTRLMPTLGEALSQFPQGHFLVQIKDGDPRVADRLVTYLGHPGADVWNRVSFFGAIAPLQRLKQIVPQARVWSGQSVSRCGTGYLEVGWFGHVPRVCDRGTIMVPIEQAAIFWGWPDRFLARMRAHHTQVMLFGKIESISDRRFSRLDTLDEVSRIPEGFDGLIWTDRIDVVGPALHSKRFGP